MGSCGAYFVVAAGFSDWCDAGSSWFVGLVGLVVVAIVAVIIVVRWALASLGAEIENYLFGPWFLSVVCKPPLP